MYLHNILDCDITSFLEICWFGRILNTVENKISYDVLNNFITSSYLICYIIFNSQI